MRDTDAHGRRDKETTDGHIASETVKLPSWDEAFPHFIATAVVMAMLLLMSRLLFRDRPGSPNDVESESITVIFIERPTIPAPKHPASSATESSEWAKPSVAKAKHDRALIDLPILEPGKVADPSLLQKLYTSEGRVRLPSGMRESPIFSDKRPPGTSGDDAPSRTDRLLKRPMAVQYRETRFEKGWMSDGTLGDVAARKLGQSLQGLNGLSKAILGEDQPAQARPPPDVPFNPALHERPSDLGSEATGNAYKAAPIAFEKAPDLKGEASRRIRQAVKKLMADHADCEVSRLQRFLAPVQTHLADLERAEYSLAHGADSIQAEHLLPRIADLAYDQSRRALWHADHELANCRNVP